MLKGIAIPRLASQRFPRSGEVFGAKGMVGDPLAQFRAMIRLLT